MPDSDDVAAATCDEAAIERVEWQPTSPSDPFGLLRAALARAEAAERERDELREEAGPIDRRLLQSVMLAIAHCDEETDAEGLCSCAHYIGGLLRTHRRAACRAGKLADQAVARADRAEAEAERTAKVLVEQTKARARAEAELLSMKAESVRVITGFDVIEADTRELIARAEKAEADARHWRGRCSTAEAVIQAARPLGETILDDHELTIVCAEILRRIAAFDAWEGKR